MGTCERLSDDQCKTCARHASPRAGRLFDGLRSLSFLKLRLPSRGPGVAANTPSDAIFPGWDGVDTQSPDGQVALVGLHSEVCAPENVTAN